MKDCLLALVIAVSLAVGFFYEPPASASVELIHVEKVHVVEPWENAEVIAKQYLPYLFYSSFHCHTSFKC